MKRKLQKEWLRSYLWSGPSLLLIALVVVFPILYTFYISLTNMNVYHWFDFTIIGLKAITSCNTILTTVHKTVTRSADKNPESKTNSARI